MGKNWLLPQGDASRAERLPDKCTIRMKAASAADADAGRRWMGDVCIDRQVEANRRPTYGQDEL